MALTLKNIYLNYFPGIKLLFHLNKPFKLGNSTDGNAIPKLSTRLLRETNEYPLKKVFLYHE